MGFTLELNQPQASEVPNIGSRACTAGGSGAHNYAIGQPAARQTIEDGTNNVSVSCTVRGDGTFSAEAHGYDTFNHEKLSLAVSGRITDKTKNSPSNSGQFSFYTPSTLAMQTKAEYPGCTFGPVQTLKKGAILTDIKCPIIASSDDSSTGCRVTGTIAFEFCKTGEEED